VLAACNAVIPYPHYVAQSVETDCGVHEGSYSLGTGWGEEGGNSMGLIQLEREVYHTLLSIADVNLLAPELFF